MPVPPPSDINYFVIQDSTLPAPTLETPTRVEYDLTGSFLFLAQAEPGDLAWVFRTLACSRDGVSDLTVALDIRISDQNIAQPEFVAAGEEVVCTATFGWDPPAYEFTIATEILGFAPSDPGEVAMTIDGFRNVSIPLGEQTTIASEVDQIVIAPIEPPDGWTVVGGSCSGTNLLIEEEPGAEYIAVFNDPTPTCIFQVQSPLSGPAPFVKHGTATWDPTSDHTAIAVNEAGIGALAAVKADGRLYVRRIGLAGDFDPWVKLGASDWAAADLAIDEGGTVELIGVKTDGRLFTRSWPFEEDFGPWVRHGKATWEPGIQPAITTNSDTVALAAIKADGRLYTRQRTWPSTEWSDFTRHGRDGWAHVDLTIASFETVSFVATKQDGRLYTRHFVNSSWGDFIRHGQPTWSPTAPPSIAGKNGVTVFAAIKSDGRLFTRLGLEVGDDGAFWPHGPAFTWRQAAIEMARNGAVAIVGIQDNGQLSTKVGGLEDTTWVDHGRPTWSTDAAPAITYPETGPWLIALKANGLLYSRFLQ